MTEAQMRSFIEQYIQTHRDNALRNLLLEKEQKDTKTNRRREREPSKSFIEYWINEDGDIAIAVRETVKACTTSKASAIRRLKDFIHKLESETDERYDITWPPIDIDRDFERMIYMMRALQERPDLQDTDSIVDFLSDKLWIGERTINDDLSRMNNADHSHQATLLNNTLAINGMKRSDGEISFLSTAHPLLLIENLACLTMMLNAMLEKAEDPMLHDGLMLTVGHIWNQLTDYARKKVIEASIKWYGENSEAFARLRNLTITADRLQFVPETKAFSSVEGQLMYYMKMETRCLLEYEAEDSMLFCMGVPHVNLDDVNSIYIQTDNGEKVSIPFNAIRSCKIEARLQ